MNARLLPLAGVVLLACRPRVPYSEVNLDEVRRSVASGAAALVDVRETHEWDAGHLLAARSIPLSRLETDASIAKTIPRGMPVYLHCAAGPRARRAAAILAPLGIDARPLAQGYVVLANAGFADSRR